MARAKPALEAERHVPSGSVTRNQFQKQGGVVKGDFPYDKVVAVQFKAAWEQ
jgi:hypothetical protein